MNSIVLPTSEHYADWIETYLALSPNSPIGVDTLERYSSEAVHLSAEQLQMGIRVMRKRAKALGTLYPFTVNDLFLRAKRDVQRNCYFALVLLTSRSWLRQELPSSSTSEMEVMFEELSEKALAGVWGSQGRAIRFGWPSQVGRPQTFDAALHWLANLLEIEPGTGYRPPYRKDGGVDVVSWRSFDDKKQGLPILLAQCTLQEDIISKASDIEPRVWSSWLRMDSDPLTALVVPQTITSDRDWDQIALRSLVFERTRLTRLLEGIELNTRQETWVRNSLDFLREKVDLT